MYLFVRFPCVVVYLFFFVPSKVLVLGTILFVCIHDIFHFPQELDLFF